MSLPKTYSNEEKSLASKRMKSDPQIIFFNDQITYINTLWCYPIKIMLGETVLLDSVPEMPKEAIEILNYMKSEREKYIKDNYPELCGD